MPMGLWQLLNVILVSILPRQIVPADALPPPEEMAALELQVIIVVGVILVIIVSVLILVIRAIRKNNTRRD
jgi:hypothetical protein